MLVLLNNDYRKNECPNQNGRPCAAGDILDKESWSCTCGKNKSLICSLNTTVRMKEEGLLYDDSSLDNCQWTRGPTVCCEQNWHQRVIVDNQSLGSFVENPSPSLFRNSVVVDRILGSSDQYWNQSITIWFKYLLRGSKLNKCNKLTPARVFGHCRSRRKCWTSAEARLVLVVVDHWNRAIFGTGLILPSWPRMIVVEIAESYYRTVRYRQFPWCKSAF